MATVTADYKGNPLVHYGVDIDDESKASWVELMQSPDREIEQRRVQQVCLDATYWPTIVTSKALGICGVGITCANGGLGPGPIPGLLQTNIVPRLFDTAEEGLAYVMDRWETWDYFWQSLPPFALLPVGQ